MGIKARHGMSGMGALVENRQVTYGLNPPLTVEESANT
jgi:hypothetical protein